MDHGLTEPPPKTFGRVAIFWRPFCLCGPWVYINSMLIVNEQITIADWELSENFTRSSGPGGQNVNKVSSAVELRFEAARSPNLTAYVKNRLKTLAGQRWTKDGAVIIRVEDTRMQSRNRDIARERLVELIRKATVRPKRRIATKPTYGSQRRRMDTKTKRGQVKNLRGRVTRDE